MLQFIGRERTHVEALEECQFVSDMKDCVPAVDNIKGTCREHPLCSICHLELNLRHKNTDIYENIPQDIEYGV